MKLMHLDGHGDIDFGLMTTSESDELQTMDTAFRIMVQDCASSDEAMLRQAHTFALIMESKLYPGSTPDCINAQPKGILIWRSLTQWLGGMGIIMLGLMLLSRVLGGGMALARAEDELSATTVDIKTFVAIKEKWGQILTELLEEQDKTIN